MAQRSTARDKLKNLRDGLRNGDAEICGESPKWIKDELLQRVDALLAKSSEPTFQAEAESFSLGAVRFVADRCGSKRGPKGQRLF